MEKTIITNGKKKIFDDLKRDFNFAALEYLFCNEAPGEENDTDDIVVCYFLQRQYLKRISEFGLKTNVNVSNSEQLSLWMKLYKALNQDLFLANCCIEGIWIEWNKYELHLRKRMTEPVFILLEASEHEESFFNRECRRFVQLHHDSTT